MPIVILVTILSAGGCRHHCRTNCDTDHHRLGDRLRDRREEREEGRRRDPGLENDRVVSPGVIAPRPETIPATPLPVSPGRSNTIDWDPNAPLPAPNRNSQKVPVDLPPSTVPSDPILVVPPGPSNRTLLLPDPLLVDPILRSSASKPTTEILGEPILPDGAGALPKPNGDPRTILLPQTGLNPKSDLPDSADPVGIESFMPVPGQDKVAGGKKPTLEGLDALKSRGYKTVLYLHAPDADTSAAKETVEKRGLKFVGLSVSPETIATAAKAFAELVIDATAKPLFVYDLDGIRAGSLWYVQFRTVEMLSDEVARIRAGSLGLQDPSKSDEQKRFWIAIQDLLAKR